jgi:hypothetical protein
MVCVGADMQSASDWAGLAAAQMHGVVQLLPRC